MSLLDLTEAERMEQPFPHFVRPEALDAAPAAALLAWMERDAPWRVLKDDFYEFDGVNLRETEVCPAIAPFLDAGFLDAVRRDLERVFEARLGSRAGVAVQRLLPGSDIGVHTDFGSERQTHRLLVQLNRGWTMVQGGLLMLFDEERPERITDRHCLYLPEHRSAVGFAISDRSYHAVSRVREGARFTLCISFSADA